MRGFAAISAGGPGCNSRRCTGTDEAPGSQGATTGCANERGSALILAMAAGVLLVALGSALVLIGVTETAVSGSHLRGMQMAYLADAAVARVAGELDAVGNWSDVLAGIALSSFRDGGPDGIRVADGAIIDLSALTLTLNRSAAAGPFGPDNPRWRLFAWGPAAELVGDTVPGYIAVWVADDPGERDGDPLIDGGAERGRGVLLMTAQAFGPGGVRRTVEVVVGRQPLTTRILAWRAVR